MTRETQDLTPNELKTPRERALEYCLELEKGQRLSATGFQWAYFLSQFAAVVFSGVTPILILLDNTPKFVQAIPPAIASISAGLAVYNWRASGVRSRIALASLVSERLDYELRVGLKYGASASEEDALAHFKNKVTQINLGVLRDWERVVLEEANKPTLSKLER